MVESGIREDQIFGNPKYSITSMKKQIEIHSWGIIVVDVHEIQYPEEGGSFEEIDDVSHFQQFRSSFLEREIPKSVNISFCRM